MPPDASGDPGIGEPPERRNEAQVHAPHQPALRWQVSDISIERYPVVPMRTSGVLTWGCPPTGEPAAQETAYTAMLGKGSAR